MMPVIIPVIAPLEREWNGTGVEVAVWLNVTVGVCVGEVVTVDTVVKVVPAVADVVLGRVGLRERV